MADDIKIRVGVQNNVKAGMAGVVADVEHGAARAGDSFDRKMRGVGFRETILKFFRGDLSGAVDDIAMRFQTKMGAAGVKVAGVLTAAFAGFQAGQLLDKQFGLSDKLGNVFAKRFGESEDSGLKSFEKFKDVYRDVVKSVGEDDFIPGESSQAEKVRKQVESLTAAIEKLKAVSVEGPSQGVADKMIGNLEQRLEKAKATQQEIADLEGKIKGKEAENAAIAQRGEARRDEAMQDAEKRRRFEEEAKAAGSKPGLMGRLMGQNERDMQAQADYETRIAMDDNFRRSEKQQQQQVDRADRRRQRLIKSAGESLRRWCRDKDTIGMTEQDWKDFEKRDPRAARLLKADAAQQAAEANRQNMEDLQKRAAEAAIQAQKDAAETAKNTAGIKDLKDLLAMKGGN